MRLRVRWRRSTRALLRWTRASWVTLAKAPAWEVGPRVTLLGIVAQAAGGAAGSGTLLVRTDVSVLLVLLVLLETAGEGQDYFSLCFLLFQS